MWVFAQIYDCLPQWDGIKKSKELNIMLLTFNVCKVWDHGKMSLEI